MWDVHVCPGLGSLGEAGENNPYPELSTHSLNLCPEYCTVMGNSIFCTVSSLHSFSLSVSTFPQTCLWNGIWWGDGWKEGSAQPGPCYGGSFSFLSWQCPGVTLSHSCSKDSFWDRTERGEGYWSCSHCLASGLCAWGLWARLQSYSLI